AQAEPCLTVERPDALECVPRLVRATPATLLVVQAGESVEDRVEIGRDVHAEDLDVVADIPDHRHVGGLDHIDDAANEARPAHTTREDDGLQPADPTGSSKRHA